MHKNDSRKNLIITKINNQIKKKSLDWNTKFLDNTDVVTLLLGDPFWPVIFRPVKYGQLFYAN